MPKTFAANEKPLSQRAYHEIRERVLDGRLTPGQRLPLRSIAKSLGMSMAPIGEALRELARDGLIEMEPGWGARVRKIDLDTLRNQHILRMALECEAIRQCTVRATDEQIAELTAIARELDDLVERNADPADVFELDSALHLRIAQMSGAASLVEALKSNQLVRLLARGCVIAHNVKRPTNQHSNLVDAIRSRDVDQAERAMREHCVRSMELQVSYFNTTLAS
jgi:DNA-binding GntR family transcriptional regulator